MQFFKKNIKLLLLIGFLVLSTRLLAIFVLSSHHETNYWEYGTIAHYMLEGKGYSMISFEEDKPNYHYSQSATPVPSAYMPPGYPSYLMPFFSISNTNIRNLTVLFSHACISFFCALLIMYWVNSHFTRTTSILAAMIYALIPEFIYASNSVGPTVIYHCLVFLVFILYDMYQAKKNCIHLVWLALTCVITIYFRSEFALFSIVISVLLLKQKSYKHCLYFCLIIVLLFLPWQIRNYTTFNQVIPMTTSSGLNLYRGNNPVHPGIWADDDITKDIKQLMPTAIYEQDLNKLYSKTATRYISDNLYALPYESIKKLFRFWTINYYDQRSLHPAYFVPWIILLIFATIGYTKTEKQHTAHILYYFLAYHSFIAMIFFSLPRYQTMMKIALIPLAAHGLFYCYNKFFKSKASLLHS